MKARLLSLLVCPECGRGFTWVPLGHSPLRDVGQDGRLECPHEHRYPVIAGVPRLLSTSSFPALRRRYPEYFARTDPLLWRPHGRGDRWSEPPSVLEETIDRFGYEWTKYVDYSADNFTRFLEPVRSRLGPEMLALDAGCGAGRHLQIVAEAGVEVVGVDVSWAVEAAAERATRNPLIHVVQADLLRLPFRESTFDFVYSLGVLHHLEDPRHGAAALVRTLRENGFLLAWVYMRTPRKVLLAPMRRAARLLSSRGVDVMSGILAAVEYGLVIGPYTWLCRISRRAILSSLVPRRIQEYSRLGFRVSRVDWYDRLAAPVSHPMTQGQARSLLDFPELRDQKVTAVEDSWWQCYACVQR